MADLRRFLKSQTGELFRAAITAAAAGDQRELVPDLVACLDHGDSEVLWSLRMALFTLTRKISDHHSMPHHASAGKYKYAGEPGSNRTRRRPPMNKDDPRASSGWWTYTALGILLLSFLATGALVAQRLLGKPRQVSYARYLPDQCTFVGQVRWDQFKQSEAYRSLRSLGGWSEQDEEDCLRICGVRPGDFDSILFAGDHRGVVALVQTQGPVSLDAVLDYLKLPKQETNFENEDLFVAGHLAYCKVAEKRLFLGDHKLVRQILQRTRPPVLSEKMTAFVGELTSMPGFGFGFDTATTAGCDVTIRGINLFAILNSFAQSADFCSLRCEFSANLDIAVTLGRKRTSKSSAPALDFSGVTESTRELLSRKLGVPAGFFDVPGWQTTGQRAEWTMALSPRDAIDPLLEAAAPGYFWTRVLQELAHPNHKEARQALREQGNLAVPYLARALSHRQPSVRADVVRALASLGTVAEAALPHLAQTMRDADEQVRRETVAALRATAPRSPLTRLLLLKSLSDGLASVRAAALDQLTRLPAPTLEEVPGLLTLTPSRDPFLWQELLKELGLLAVQARAEGTFDEPLMEGLLQGLTIDEEVGQAAVQQLRKVRPFSVRERPLLMKLWRTGATREQARVYALTALGEDGLATTAVLGEIAQILQKDASAPVRAAAADALGHASDDAPFATRLLLAALHDNADEVGLAAVAALGNLAPKGLDVLAALTGLVESQKIEMQTQACYALGKLGRQALLARPMLLKILPTTHGLPRSTAEQALQKIGAPRAGRCPNAGAPLADARQPGAALVRCQVARGTGPGAGAAEVSLFQEVNSPDPALRKLALGALRRHGKCPDDLLPGLLRAMEDADLEVRLEALRLIPLIDITTHRALVESWLATDGEPDTLVEVLVSLEICGKRAALLTDGVARQLSAKNQAIRLQSLKTLGAIATDEDLANLRPVFARMCLEKNSALPLQVMELARKRGTPLVPLLKETLVGADSELRLMALLTIKALGDEAADCLPELRKSLERTASAKLRLPVLAAMGAIAAGTEQAAKELGNLLKEDDADLRKTALASLAGLGPKALPAKDNLAALLRTAKREEFQAALKVVQQLKLEPKERVFLLLGAFRNPDAELNAFLAEEISKLGRPAVLPLIEQIDHPIPSVRLGVVLSLAQMGRDGHGAVGALQRRFLAETIPPLREEILNALEKVQN